MPGRAGRANERVGEKSPVPSHYPAPGTERAGVGTADQIMRLQRTAGNYAVGHLLSNFPISVRQTLATGGRPLESALRRSMERRFGTDLGHVRLHHDGPAAESAQSVRAKAYTVGNHIVFGAERYQPGTSDGARLIGHELAHVVQQSRPGDSAGAAKGAEREAVEAGGQAAAGAGGLVTIRHSAPVGLQRAPDDEEPSFLRRSLRRLKETSVGKKATELARKGEEELTAIRQDIVDTKDRVVRAGSDLVHRAEAKVTEVRQEVSKEADEAAKKAQELKQEAAKQVQRARVAVEKTTRKAVAEAKHQGSDWVMGQVGQAKGVVLEATTLVDSVIWVDYQVDVLVHSGVKAGLDYTKKKGLISENTANAVLEAHRVSSDLAGYEALAASGKVPTEEGVPSLTQLVGDKLNMAAQSLEKELAPTPASEAMLFTAYELGEIKGAVGTQVALALVGGEEFQLVVKLLNAVGGVKGIVQTVQTNANWEGDPAFWSGVVNFGLGLLGLSRAVAAKKIVQLAIKSGAVVAAIPAVKDLYRVATDRELAKDPEKHRKAMVRASRALAIAAKDIVLTVIHSSRAKAPATEAEGGTRPTIGAVADEGKLVTPRGPEELPPGLARKSTVEEVARPAAKPTAEETAAPPEEVRLAKVIPITEGEKPAGPPTKLRPGDREVTSLAEARAKRDTARRAEENEREAARQRPHRRASRPRR